MENQAKMFNETMANMAAMMQKMMVLPAEMSPMMPGSPYIQAMQAMMAHQAVSSPMSPQLINQMGVQPPITQQMPAGVPHDRFPMSHALPTQLAPTMTQTPPSPTTAVWFQQPIQQQLIAQQPTPAATPTPPPVEQTASTPAPAANQKQFGTSGGSTGWETKSDPARFVFNAGKNEEKSSIEKPKLLEKKPSPKPSEKFDGGFQFGGEPKPTPEKVPEKTNSFASGSSSTNIFGSKAPSATTSGFAFKFNSNSKPATPSSDGLSFKPREPEAKQAEEAEGDNEEPEENENEPYFEPIVKLDEVEVKTGEEDEELNEAQMKLIKRDEEHRHQVIFK